MNWLRIISHGLVLGREEFRNFWRNWRVWLLTSGVRMTTSAMTLVLLGRLLGSDDTVSYLAIGQIALVGPTLTGWAVQSFTWDRMFSRTFIHLVASPSSLVPIMVGRTTIWLVNGIGNAVLMALVLIPLFGVPVSPRQMAAVLAMCVLMSVASYGFWFCAGSLINFAPKLRNIAQNLLVTLLGGVCGVVVPVSFWPPWVQTMAAGLPVTHGLLGMRSYLEGASLSFVLSQLSQELIVGAAWFAVGLLTLDATTRVARQHGTLEMS